MSEKSGKYDVAIVGAGLTGLSIASDLQSLGLTVCVLESRARTGGRIHGIVHNNHSFDLGPAWFWNGQALIAKLAADLDLRVFQQYSTGDMLYQDASGKQIVRRSMSMMEGAKRIAGGMSALTNGLQERLNTTVKLNCRVTQLSRTESVYRIDYQQYKPQHNQQRNQQRNHAIEEKDALAHSQHSSLCINADRVVLAMPPRLIASSIDTGSLLNSSQLDSMRSIPTWMAGHAKVVAVYDKPFWRDQNLSGDAVSHHGPLVQIHDASPFESGQGALFGFVGVPARQRIGNDSADQLLASAQLQLATLFGRDAQTPVKIYLQDWAEQSDTATTDDMNSPPTHPAYGMPAILQSIEDDSLILAATELASSNGGLLEGALEIASETVQRIGQTLDNSALTTTR